METKNPERRDRLLGDIPLGQVIQQDTKKWAICNKDFLIDVARVCSSAQDRATLRFIGDWLETIYTACQGDLTLFGQEVYKEIETFQKGW